ncbi:hypothetical protein OG889_32775 [Streptomyces sp. NBC_00481]|uniref:hypothetical protein n=1 Tax=Streptomyces sp. NBC_00481 TaxID=2975755 RepID=UPI002DD7B521|nr:hypothetical protein [Streptomyces sp. NBC_00481]WRY99048.1 hypothetical protein OG889_32775 [Streptomyces sp. NBC_00481]
MAVEMGSSPFEGLAKGAGMDPKTVRSLAENGNLELAVRRYQRLKTGSVSRGRCTPRQAQVEMLRRRAVTT